MEDRSLSDWLSGLSIVSQPQAVCDHFNQQSVPAAHRQ